MVPLNSCAISGVNFNTQIDTYLVEDNVGQVMPDYTKVFNFMIAWPVGLSSEEIAFWLPFYSV